MSINAPPPTYTYRPVQTAIPSEDALLLPMYFFSAYVQVDLPKSIIDDFLRGRLALRASIAAMPTLMYILTKHDCVWAATGIPVDLSDTFSDSPKSIYVTCYPHKNAVLWSHINPLKSLVDLDEYLESVNKDYHFPLLARDLFNGMSGVTYTPHDSVVIPTADMVHSSYLSGHPCNDLSMSDKRYAEFLKGKFSIFVKAGDYIPVFSFFKSKNLTWKRTGTMIDVTNVPAGNPEHIILSYDKGLVWHCSLPSFEASDAVHPVYILYVDPWIAGAEDMPNECIVDYRINMCNPPSPDNSSVSHSKLKSGAAKGLHLLNQQGLLPQVYENLKKMMEENDTED